MMNKLKIWSVFCTVSVAILFIIGAFIPIINVKAGTTSGMKVSDGYEYNYQVDITKYIRDGLIPATYENRIIDNGWYNGPMDTMVKASNGNYLGFIREGIDHVGNNGSLKMYKSIDNAVHWTLTSTLANQTNWDYRNYACGISSTGRIFIFYQPYDFVNATWPLPYIYEKYSDNNGTTWTVVNLTFPTINGHIPQDANPYGSLQIYTNNRIGLCYFAGNGTATQPRFMYSDNNGINWSHSAMGIPINGPYYVTETNAISIGSNGIVALARMDAGTSPMMYRSLDNGITWINDGLLWFNLYAGTKTSMCTVIDNKGENWILALLQANDNKYMIANANDLLIYGMEAWTEPVDDSYYGSYPTILFDSSTGKGFIMVDIGANVNIQYVAIWNITVSITQGINLISHRPIDLYNSFFIVLLVLGAIVAIGMIIIQYGSVTVGRTLEDKIYILVIMIVAIFIVAIFIAGMAGLFRI